MNICPMAPTRASPTRYIMTSGYMDTKLINLNTSPLNNTPTERISDDLKYKTRLTLILINLLQYI